MPISATETIRSLYAGFNEAARGGDVGAFVATHFDPEIEYWPVEEITVVCGHAALVDYFERWFEPWEEMGATVDEIIETGERVFVALTMRGRGGESDAEIAQLFFHVFELREGRALRVLEYLDRLPAVEAAGLAG